MQKVSRLCKIAALQYYAKNKGLLEEKNRGQVAKIIRELFEENCLLPVLQQFADLVPEVWEILDKTFVVYEGEPEKQLVLNYRRVEGNWRKRSIMKWSFHASATAFMRRDLFCFRESGCSIISQCPKGRKNFGKWHVACTGGSCRGNAGQVRMAL